MKIADVLLTKEQLEEKINTEFLRFHKLGTQDFLKKKYDDSSFISESLYETEELIASLQEEYIITKVLPINLYSRNTIFIGNKYPFKNDFLTIITPLYKRLAEISVFSYRKKPDIQSTVFIEENINGTSLCIKASSINSFQND